MEGILVNHTSILNSLRIAYPSLYPRVIIPSSSLEFRFREILMSQNKHRNTKSKFPIPKEFCETNMLKDYLELSDQNHDFIYFYFILV